MFKTKITLPELEQNFIGSYNKKQERHWSSAQTE